MSIQSNLYHEKKLTERNELCRSRWRGEVEPLAARRSGRPNRCSCHCGTIDAARRRELRALQRHPLSLQRVEPQLRRPHLRAQRIEADATIAARGSAAKQR